eukprot:m51a1_g13116 hypothetical protein (161) ;mRNA; r:225-707
MPEDKTLICEQCGQAFDFTVRQQRLHLRLHFVDPKRSPTAPRPLHHCSTEKPHWQLRRCKHCREERKDQTAAAIVELAQAYVSLRASHLPPGDLRTQLSAKQRENPEGCHTTPRAFRKIEDEEVATAAADLARLEEVRRERELLGARRRQRLAEKTAQRP